MRRNASERDSSQGVLRLDACEDRRGRRPINRQGTCHFIRKCRRERQRRGEPAPSINIRPKYNRASLLTPVNSGPTLARYKTKQIDGKQGYQPVAVAVRLQSKIRRGFMLVRVKARVEAVGEVEELADISRPHRTGAVVGALMEELERAHPGISLLEHVLTIVSKPTKGKPDGTAIIR